MSGLTEARTRTGAGVIALTELKPICSSGKSLTLQFIQVVSEFIHLFQQTNLILLLLSFLLRVV